MAVTKQIGKVSLHALFRDPVLNRDELHLRVHIDAASPELYKKDICRVFRLHYQFPIHDRKVKV